MKNESECGKNTEKLMLCELRASHWERTGRIAKLTFDDENVLWSPKALKSTSV